MGPVPPLVLDWADFVETLIHAAGPPAPVDDDPAGDVVSFRPDPEPLVSPETLAAAHAVLSRVPLPARLSTLLAACPTGDGVGARPCRPDGRGQPARVRQLRHATANPPVPPWAVG